MKRKEVKRQASTCFPIDLKIPFMLPCRFPKKTRGIIPIVEELITDSIALS